MDRHSRAVFISYASADSVVADSVVASLESLGVGCWIAPRDVRPGAVYAEAIVRAIGDAKAMVLVLSANSVASTHVGKEVERASSKRRPVIALRIDDAPLSPALEYFLSESHWIDARAGGMDAALSKFVAAIREPSLSPAGSLAAGTSAVTEAARPPRLRGSRILLPAGIAVVTVALAYFAVDRFWISKHPTNAQKAATVPVGSAISETSIAVLPFVDMSEKKDQEYFSDGMAEEIIDLLVKVPELKVPARTSSFYFKGKSVQIPDIARQLGVANLLEGSVRKSGSHLRVTAQLVRADNGFHLWSETYDRQLDDVFKVQDEIAAAVVGALKLKLFAAPIANNGQTANPEAYNNYLIGRHLLSSSNWMLDHSAAEAFRKAVDLDPNYAQAWVGLAEATFAEADETSGTKYSTMTQEALTTADKAVTLAPDLADGFAVRGYIRSWGQWDFQGAADDFRRALALDPNNPYVLSKYSGSVLMPTGHLDESVAAVETALTLDPLNADSWRRLGIQQFYRDDYRAAREALQRSLEINPEQSITAAYLGLTFLFLKEPSNALTISQRATSESWRLQVAALAEHDLGHAEAAQKRLDEMIVKDADSPDPIAEVYAWFGETDRAFEWLQKAYAEHDTALTMVKVDPLLKSLHSDPRYAALLRKMNLQE